ncbi:MAG: SUMF1/EgtB/PvdO family nonheme iron enzyme [Kiritimatiellae bacterium]|nr:SUMF1/EgtB/PvdO family nonheme iron enzyme [Kiritimatiellia bacterium]
MQKIVSILALALPICAFAAQDYVSINLNTYKIEELKALSSSPAPNGEKIVLAKLPNGLYAGVYEVLQRQWEIVMGDRPSFFSNDKYYALRPVECVSYDDAHKFLEVLSARTGLAFSLPTMEEWEYAARAGVEGDYTDGSFMKDPDQDEALDSLGRYYYNGGRGYTRDCGPENGTAIAGSYKPNAWGLYDMLGNVREWALGDAKCGTRMYSRGGGWGLNAKKCTISLFTYFPDRTSDAPTSGLRIFSKLEKFTPPAEASSEYVKKNPYKGPVMKKDASRDEVKALWDEYMKPPAEYLNFERKVTLIRKFDWPECDGELYLQANGPGTFQKVLFTFPKNMKGKVPGIVVPYYAPADMIARNFDTGADIKGQLPVAFMRHFAVRGWASMCSETYHLNYIPGLKIKDFSKWTITAKKFYSDWPTWNCMAKKVFDTKIATDIFLADPRIDTTRVGICGHSLGGQGSFYSGMLDDRIKAVVASDFGYRFDQTHWESPWYWSTHLNEARRRGLDNNQLLIIGKSKPLCIISGKTDDSTTQNEIMDSGAYSKRPDDFLFLNHQCAHRPPMYILETAYRFLERKLNDYPRR